MVGILLNSCSPRENSNDLHLSLGFVFEGAEASAGAMSYKFRIGLDVNKEVNGNA